MAAAMEIVIRPQGDQDYPALVEIHRALYPDWPISATEIREHEQEIDPSRFIQVRLVAQDRAAGRVVAVGNYHQLPWSYHPDRYRLRLHVHPDWQRRGIGRQLMGELLGQLEARGVKWAQASAREDFARSTAFLQRFGFVEHARSFASRLQVASCDLTALADYARRVGKLGIALTTVREEMERDPTCLPAVYEMHCLVDMGVPQDDPGLPTPSSYAHFLRTAVHGVLALPDAYFLAKLGDMYVAESILRRSDADPGFLHQELTGVVPDCRGQGIATALKLRTVEYAQRHGYREIQTRNSSRNAPMLAINTKLGFVREPAWIEFQKTF